MVVGSSSATPTVALLNACAQSSSEVSMTEASAKERFSAKDDATAAARRQPGADAANVSRWLQRREAEIALRNILRIGEGANNESFEGHW